MQEMIVSQDIDLKLIVTGLDNSQLIELRDFVDREIFLSNRAIKEGSEVKKWTNARIVIRKKPQL